jgi:hypothetical protein
VHEEDLRDTESRGLAVVTRDLEVKDNPSARFLDVACRDPDGYAAFNLIGGELADGLSLGVSPPSAVTMQVLARWRRFWGEREAYRGKRNWTVRRTVVSQCVASSCMRCSGSGSALARASRVTPRL